MLRIAPDDTESAVWRRNFVQTYLLRDLGQLQVGDVNPQLMRQLWTMLAHSHGQVLNSASMARSLGVSDHTIRRYVDVLAGTWMVQALQPWFANVKKRQVKRPKVYLADSGVLHSLLMLETATDVERHPILGASWEGFAMQQVIQRLGARPEECFFWSTHAGAQLDLFVVRGNTRLGFDFKRTETPKRTKSMHAARTTLGLDRLDVVYGGRHTWDMGEQTRALPLSRILDDLEPP